MGNLTANAQLVLDALTEIGQGTTAEIREKTGKTTRVTDKAVRELADAGLIVETDPGDGNPARWSIAAPAEPTGPDETSTTTDAEPDPVTDDTAAEPADAYTGAATDQQEETTQHPTGDPDDAANLTVGDDGSGQPADDSTGAEEPARPRPADRKVLAVRGVLGDYPDGATIEVIADACGFNPGVVARLLQAMEQADAARRIPDDTEAGTPQRWQPGPGKASEVDPNPAPPRCPTCGQVIRTGTPKAATATPRGGGSGTVNSDGNEPLGRNVLRGWVLEFINSQPGHVFTPQTIADALGMQHGREISSGAVRNNCTALAAAGQIQLATETPLAFTANPPAHSSGQ
jgi:hypothetical protein